MGPAAAIAGAFAYALIAGATMPTLRAFMMVGLVLTAVMLDRRGLSMRLLAWAALAILILQPVILEAPEHTLDGVSVFVSFAVEGMRLFPVFLVGNDRLDVPA